jgi:hypothetical protein
MKLCKDCRWADDQEYGAWMCRHPQAMHRAERSTVTGEMEEPSPRHCKLARCTPPCDLDGALWEPEEDNPWGFV